MTHLRFLQTKTPCYPDSKNQWECLAAAPADAILGKHPVEILWEENPIFSSAVEIVHKEFPLETLTLTDEKKSLLSVQNRDEEVKKIKKALNMETGKKLGRENFIQPVPVHEHIESVYGERRILDGVVRQGFHRGLDIGATEGTAIHSSNNGRIVLAEEFSQEGKMVAVNHGQGVVSAYLHLSEILVSKNQKIKKGEIIGKVGSTGVSNTPHLHFGIYIHGVPIDPLYWLDRFKTTLE